MREHKYRVWDEEKRKFLKKDSYILYFDAIGSSVFEHETYRQLHDYKLLQYTGLNDTNGNEIYEGYIVKINYMDPIEKAHFVGEVKYYEGAYWVDNDIDAQRLFQEINLIEVIGNIHENPELLKGDSNG